MFYKAAGSEKVLPSGTEFSPPSNIDLFTKFQIELALIVELKQLFVGYNSSSCVFTLRQSLLGKSLQSP